MTPGEYVRRCRERAGLSIDRTGMILAALGLGPADVMAAIVTQIEADLLRPNSRLLRQLENAFPFHPALYRLLRARADAWPN